MNKLISRNPVLRFKLGRKIGKFLNPGSTLPVLYKLLPAVVLKQLPAVALKVGGSRALNFLGKWLGPAAVAGYGVYATEKKRQERNSNIQRNLNRWYLAGRANDRNPIWVDRTTGKLYKGLTPAAMNELELADYMKKNLIGDSYSGYNITKMFSDEGPNFTINGRDYMYKQGTKTPYDLSPEAQKVIADRNAKLAALNNKENSNRNNNGNKNSNVKSSTNTYNAPTFRGVTIGGKVKDFSNAITEDLRNQLINSGAFTNDDFNDTMSFQNALNRYFGKDGYGSVKEDGMWGNQTQNAFELALQKAKAPVVNTTLGIIVQEEPSLAPLSKPNLDVTNINIPKQTVRSGNFDRSQIRDMIRQGGFNPYNYTGELRKALRLYLNGQSDDTSLLDGTDLARFTLPFRKKGGILPSRNIVERFKNGRKIIFAQGGTYFPVTVGGRTYQYNPYNGSYKGTQGSGLNISYKDIEETFNKQYEGVSHSGSKVYRRKGSHTTWTNSAGKQVNLAPAKKAQPNTSFKTSANGRFRVVDLTSGKELRFDSRDEAKKYQMSATKLGTRVLYDDKKEGYGVLKVDRTKEKSTEWARNQRETNNNKSRAEAYKAARERGDRWFAYDGKVYSSDLKNYKNDNLTEMKAIYGNALGWGKDPKYNTKSSAQARNAQNKEIKALNSNRNANYQGKTNKLASAEADKKVAQTWNERDFVDAILPATAVGNALNAAGSWMAGEKFTPKVFHSGLNAAGGMADLMEGNWSNVGERALNAASIFGGPWVGKGVQWLGVKAAPKIATVSDKSRYLFNTPGTKIGTKFLEDGSGKVLNNFAEGAISRGNGFRFGTGASSYGRYSIQNAIDLGVLNGNKVLPKVSQWANTAVRNGNTGTTYFYRNVDKAGNLISHPYDAAVDNAVKIFPWLSTVGGSVSSTTLNNFSE